MKLNEKFKPLLTSPSRYFLVTGGRGSGKSFAVSTYLLTLTFDTGQKILFTRYTLTSAKVSIIPEFIEKIEMLDCQHAFHITSDSIINTITGSSIIFKGVKTSSGVQTANLKSLQGVTTWVLDEAEELPDEDTFDKIDLSIRQKGVQNRVILLMNPTTKEHFIYKRFFEGKVNDGYSGTQDDRTYIHTTYNDNIPNLEESFLKRVKTIEQTNPGKYKHAIMGGWLDKAEGVIYDNWELGDFPDIPYIFGLDFGFSPDPTAMVKVGVDGRTIYMEECFYKTNLSTDEIELNIKQHAKQDDLIVGDSAEKRLINELITRGLNLVPCQKGKDSIKNGIGLIKGYKLVINGDNLVRELNNYIWNDKKSSTPIDDYNHLLDAGRYATVRLLQGFFVL